MVTAGYSPTTEQLLLLALWLLVLPIVIPIITGGISSWYIDGMRVYGGILLGIPVGIANIFWGLVWASAFGGGLDELYRAIPLEDRPTPGCHVDCGDDPDDRFYGRVDAAGRWFSKKG